MKRKETSPALRSRGCQCGFLSTGLRTVDILGYYPPDLQRSYNESKHELGGIMSILIPAVLGVVYYLMYLTNEQQPPVLQTSVSSGNEGPVAFKIHTSCKRLDTHGNANPFCQDGAAGVPTPVGFQYISSLMSSPCASSVDKFSPNPYWLDNYVSPTAAKLSSVNNLTAASQKRVFQKAVHKVREATSDLFYDGLLWKGAGAPVFFSPQPGLSRAPGLDASFYYNDSFSYTPDFVEAVSVAHPSEFFEAQVLTGVNFSARFFDALLLPFSYDGPLQMEREGGGPADAQQAVQLARDAAAKGANVVTGFEIPLCSFPDTRSPTVESTPSTSGLGFLAALPASFNWSSNCYGQNSTFCSGANAGMLDPQEDPDLFRFSVVDVLTGAIIPVNVTQSFTALDWLPPRTPFDFFEWYGTSSHSSDVTLHFPYMTYSLDIVVTTYSDNSRPRTVTATATTSSGMMRHKDDLNYFGYGDTGLLTFAEGGDFYVVNDADLATLERLARAGGGFTGAHEDFLAPGSVTLADMLPAQALPNAHACDEGLYGDAWPAKQCASSVRSRISGAGAGARGAALNEGVDVPLTTDVGTAPSDLADLRGAYASIVRTTELFMHGAVLPTDKANALVRAENAGWAIAQDVASSLGALMQLQHGCGFYSIEERKHGLGTASSLRGAAQFLQPWALVNSSELLTHTYVQRTRPALVCGNVKMALPWVRTSDRDAIDKGDLSELVPVPSFGAFSMSRNAAPLVAILFRINSVTEQVYASTRLSPLQLLGTTLGYLGTALMTLTIIKRAILSVCGNDAAGFCDYLLAKTERAARGQRSSARGLQGSSKSIAKGPGKHLDPEEDNSSSEEEGGSIRDEEEEEEDVSDDGGDGGGADNTAASFRRSSSSSMRNGIRSTAASSSATLSRMRSSKKTLSRKPSSATSLGGGATESRRSLGEEQLGGAGDVGSQSRSSVAVNVAAAAAAAADDDDGSSVDSSSSE